MDGCPSHNPLDPHSFVDSDWAACPQTQCSFSGTCLCLAGGCIAYKTQLLPTVTLLSTKAEYMGACNSGKMILFVRSVLWDLGVPQSAALVLYEDNDMHVLPWPTHKNLQVAPDTWISNTIYSVNGWNATYLSSLELTLLSTCPLILQNSWDPLIPPPC